MGTERGRGPHDRVLIAASILDADAANLEREIRRGERGGVDRFHLDVMDGHFVPNISFGPATVAAIRRVTRLPLDVHLMISQPGRYVARFLEAGADSISFHLEVDEPKEPTIRAILSADRAVGLVINPETPVEALAPFLELIDIVMVMGVHPGFGGQSLIAESVPKIPAARRLFEGRRKRVAIEMQVDGGVHRENAELLGAAGVDVLVAGSALYRRGARLASEVTFLREQAGRGRASETR